MDILQRKIIDPGQLCYCMIASVNEPYVYLRFKAKVLHRWIQGDNIGYYLHLQEVLEDFDTIRDYLHRSKQRVFSLQSERGQIKTIDCFDLTTNMKMFDKNFRKRYSDYTWYSPAVFVFTTISELESELDKSNTLLQQRLSSSLRILNDRKSRKKIEKR